MATRGFIFLKFCSSNQFTAYFKDTYLKFLILIFIEKNIITKEKY